MKFLLSLLLSYALSFADSPPTDRSNTLPSVSSAATFFGGGVGLLDTTQPRPTPWFVVATPLVKAQGVYSFSETDYSIVGKKVQSSVRSGLALNLRSFGKITLYALGDAGVSTVGNTTGSAYSGGGIVLVPIGKTSFYTILGTRYLHSATGGNVTLVEIGVGKKIVK